MNLTSSETINRIMDFAERVITDPVVRAKVGAKKRVRLYGVPRGGVPVVLALAAMRLQWFKIVDVAEDADVIVDDIVDSGATMEKYRLLYPDKPFLALIDKKAGQDTDGWVVFPWEETEERGIEDHFTRILQYMEYDPQDKTEDMVRTLHAYSHLLRPYLVKDYRVVHADIYLEPKEPLGTSVKIGLPFGCKQRDR